MNPCDSGNTHKKAHELSKQPTPWNLADEAWTANVAQLLSGCFGEFVCTWLNHHLKYVQDSFYRKSIVEAIRRLRYILPLSHQPKTVADSFDKFGLTMPEPDQREILRYVPSIATVLLATTSFAGALRAVSMRPEKRLQG